MSTQCKIQVRFCGAGAGMGAVLRKGAVLGTGAGMVRVRVRFAGAGAGAELVRVRIFRCGFAGAGAGAVKFFGAGNNINDLYNILRNLNNFLSQHKIRLNFESLVSSTVTQRKNSLLSGKLI